MVEVVINRSHAGRAREPVQWEAILRIFDSMWGPGARALPKYPNVIGAVHASWRDADGNLHKAESIEEVERAYRNFETSFVRFSGRLDKGPRGEFSYWPARAEASMRVETGDEDTAERIVAAMQEEFPLLARYVFISYETEEIVLADFVKKVLEGRLDKGVSVFVAKRDIKPGANPLKIMLEEELPRAEALIALCSKKSKNSPWLWWESAAVWAKGGLVVPLFIDLSPKEFDGPLTLVCQGRYFFDKEDMDAALRAIVSKVSPGLSFREITSEEIAELEKLREQFFAGKKSVYEERGLLFLN